MYIYTFVLVYIYASVTGEGKKPQKTKLNAIQIIMYRVNLTRFMSDSKDKQL